MSEQTEFIKIEEAYEEIKNARKKHGDFHKCLFHIHTPASHDFCLYESHRNTDFYKKLSDKEMFDIAKDEGLFKYIFDSGITNFSFKDFKIDEGEEKFFIDKKEYLTYLLIAHKLIQNSIELVVIADHNTYAGYEKLESAIRCYNHNVPASRYPHIIFGIEISCGDSMHVVGIFDNKIENRLQFFDWLDKNILSIELGTYHTSYQVLEKINELNGIGYIAHINTSKIFDDATSGAYKKKLFENKNIFIGLSDLEKKDDCINKLKNFKCKSIAYFLDSDSHSIDTLGQKSFWIKGQKLDYNMLKNAFRDYDIAVRFDKPKEPQKFILGISILSGTKGFLKGKSNKIMMLPFSNSLNCFIGGRGTGKSTIINILNFVLGQRLPKEEEVAKNILELICRHEHIVVFYRYNGKDYAIGFLTPKGKYENDAIFKWFVKSYYFLNDHDRQYRFDRDEIADKTLKDCINIYEMQPSENGINKNELVNKAEKKKLLEKMFYSGYAINDLVRIADSKKRTSDFIKSIIFRNETKTLPNFTQGNSDNQIKLLINDIKNYIEKDYANLSTVINKINSFSKDKLKITICKDKYLYNAIFFDENFVNDDDDIFIDFNIRNKNTNGYLINLIEKLGLFDFLLYFIDKSYDKITKCLPWDEYVIDEHEREKRSNDGIRKIITKKTELEFYEMLRRIVLKKNWRKKLLDIVSDGVFFDMEFNINNNKEHGNNAKPIFKPIMSLSLGQKVVAMLSFILTYSKYSDDTTPLILDQPEDNLDNQYIHKTLVQDLRDVKDLKQVIIATHNSTIVTNAKAEKVIVMNSNNINGWVDCEGYPSEPKIVHQIINLLEGGAESFVHKSFIYKNEILNILN